MPDAFDKIQRMFSPSMRGLTSQFSPQILRGILIEYLSKFDLNEIMTWVETNKSLWFDVMAPEHRNMVIRMATKMGGRIKLPTSDQLIVAIGKDLPRVASLFLGWRKARNWLDRQLVELQEQLGGKHES